MRPDDIIFWSLAIGCFLGGGAFGLCVGAMLAWSNRDYAIGMAEIAGERKGWADCEAALRRSGVRVP